MAKNKKTPIQHAKELAHKPKGGTKATPDDFDRSTPDTLASLVDAWLTRLEERAYSPRTLDMNRWTLRGFLQWCHQRDLIDPKTITKSHLEAYQRWLFRHRKKNGQPLSIRTQRQRLGSIQRLFAHLCKTNHLPANPAADLELPRQPARLLPKGLPQDELQNLLSQPDILDPLGIRDRAILETLYATGCRRTELCRLELHDLDPLAQTLHIRHAKGGKSRLVPIGRQALHWLENYMQNTRPQLLLDPAENALFLTGYGQAFSPGSLGNLIKKLMTAAGIHRPGSTHLLRHTCATHMLENGADIRLIQQLLGHAKLDTTSLYTEVAITHLQEVYNRAHPSAKA